MIMIMSMMMRSRGVGSRGETRQRCRMKTTSHPVNRAQGSFPSVKVSAPTNHCLKILSQLSRGIVPKTRFHLITRDSLQTSQISQKWENSLMK